MNCYPWLIFIISLYYSCAQRITTIQLDDIQYFISRMNPYSIELNYFLAYQYCRSLGLQLVSFGSKEKADSMLEYLKTAGYSKTDFWTSGNSLGTEKFLWMSTGLPFNSTFDYMKTISEDRQTDVAGVKEPQSDTRKSTSNSNINGCVALTSPTLGWSAVDCRLSKHFICEQTRCNYYNYGSMHVPATQGTSHLYDNTMNVSRIDLSSTSISNILKPATVQPGKLNMFKENEDLNISATENSPEILVHIKKLEDKMSSRKNLDSFDDRNMTLKKLVIANSENKNSYDHLPYIISMFINNRNLKGDALTDIKPHQIRLTEFPSVESKQHAIMEEYSKSIMESTQNPAAERYTIGPYDSMEFDYLADQEEVSQMTQEKFPGNPDDESSTILPDDEPSYRYNIKVRNNSRMLDFPSI